MTLRFDYPQLLWLALLVVPVVVMGTRSLALLDPTRRRTAIGLRVVVVLILVAMLAGIQTVRWHTDLTVITVVDQSESVRRLAPAPPTPAATGVGDTGGDSPTPPTNHHDWITDWVRGSTGEHEVGDRLGLVTYDARPTVHALPSSTFDLERSTLDDPAPGTDTAAALRLAMALFPPDTGKRLVLVSDGNDTAVGSLSDDLTAPAAPTSSQDLLELAREARAAGIPIDVLPVEYRLENEVVLEALHAPAVARQGQTVALRIVLRAARPADGLVQVKHDGRLVDLNGPGDGTGMPVRQRHWTLESDTPTAIQAGAPTSPGARTLGRYVHMLKLDLPLVYAGPNQFEVVFEPGPYTPPSAPPIAHNDGTSPDGALPNRRVAGVGDTISANNRAQTFTLVHGKGRVLFVADPTKADHDEASTHILPTALQAHGVDLDRVPPQAIPTRLSRLQGYDAVILQDVASETVSIGQQKLLARYVNDLGGGLIMVGGPDSFGPGGWANSPVDRVLPVDAEVTNTTLLPSGALVLVLDRSGSMGSPVSGSPYTQQDIANESAVLALTTLYPQDMVGVVAFDSSPKWVVKLQMNDSPNDVARQIRKIQPGGGTDIYPALEAAYEALAPLTTQDAAIKHVILLTDGQSQSGKYFDVVGRMARADITLTTIGIGDGANNQLLDQLAMMGGGTFHRVADPNTLPQVFIKEARTIRRNLIKEVDFTPKLVRTGSPIADGLAGVPVLHGFVRTEPKKDPRVFIPMLGPEGEPIFAHWQVGLGRSAAFTSDATNRWASDWLDWVGYADFWARTVRAIARPQPTQNADLLTTINADRLHIRLDTASGTPNTSGGRRNRPDSFANFLTVAGSVMNPDGTVTPVTLKQTAPGIYEATTAAPVPGNYLVSLFTEGGSGTRKGRTDGSRGGALFGGANKPTTPELRALTSNRSRLEEVARITGGRVLDPGTTAPDTLFKRTAIAPSRSIRPMWQPLLLWLFAVFWLDVAARRIAWDLPTIRAWCATRARSFSKMLKGREADATGTLDALKRRAARFDDQTRAATTAATRPSTGGGPDAGTKFQADPLGTPEAADLTTALGAATDNPTEQTGRPTPPTPADTTDQGQDTTSRLLNTKRRTRDRTTPQSPDDHETLPKDQNPGS